MIIGEIYIFCEGPVRKHRTFCDILDRRFWVQGTVSTIIDFCAYYKLAGKEKDYAV